MTPQEAIEVIESHRPTSGYIMLNEALDIAKEALTKQIPKKPKKLTYKLLIDSGWEYECPNCGYAIGKNKYIDYEYFEEYEGYCQNCGQALDWSDN